LNHLKQTHASTYLRSLMSSCSRCSTSRFAAATRCHADSRFSAPMRLFRAAGFLVADAGQWSHSFARTSFISTRLLFDSSISFCLRTYTVRVSDMRINRR
jgi:hypothetical protein